MTGLKGDPINALFGDYGLFTNPTGAWDKFKNGDTNEVNRQIAEQNLQFQRESLDYNKALNEEILNRADTAYQRQVADLRAAGISPLMAQGGAETGGSATPIESMHNDYQHQDIGGLSALQGIGDLLNTVQNYEIGFSKARESRAIADSAKAQATVDIQTAMDKIKQSKMDTRAKKMAEIELSRIWDYNNYFGINNNMSEKERMFSILNRSLNPDKRYTRIGFDNENNITKFDMVEGKENENYKDLAAQVLARQFTDILGELIP